MLVVEIHLQLFHARLQQVEVPSLGVRTSGADEFQIGILGAQGGIELLQSLSKHGAIATMSLIIVPLLIPHTEVFQVEGLGMAHLGTHLTPLGVHWAIGKLHEVESILDI